MLLLSSDIGGTNTRMLLTDYSSSAAKVIKNINYTNSEFSSFEDVVRAFVSDIDQKIAGACFAASGPIINDSVKLANLPWIITVARLQAVLGINSVALINDFAAIGYGLETLKPEEILILQEGRPNSSGLRAYIGAGTGLGVGFVTHTGKHWQVHPTEGGHIDFAPTDDIQIELLKFLLKTKKYSRVSYERVLSGPGLVHIYIFVCAQAGKNIDLDDSQAATITRLALEEQDLFAKEAVDIFIRIYGAAVGNLALTTLPFGGLYIVGGIAPKLLNLMKGEDFIKNFGAKGRSSELLKGIPLGVVLATDLGLRGAAICARQFL